MRAYRRICMYIWECEYACTSDTCALRSVQSHVRIQTCWPVRMNERIHTQAHACVPARASARTCACAHVERVHMHFHLILCALEHIWIPAHNITHIAHIHTFLHAHTHAERTYRNTQLRRRFGRGAQRQGAARQLTPCLPAVCMRLRFPVCMDLICWGATRNRLTVYISHRLACFMCPHVYHDGLYIT